MKAMIPNTSGLYWAGDDGMIYRGDRPLRPWVGGNSGYLQVSLSVSGVVRRRTVHSLVLEAFVGQRPEGAECLHIDGNKLHNARGNLRWGTRRENAHDRYQHGYTMSASARAKSSRALKGRPLSVAHKAKLSAAKIGNQNARKEAR